MKLTIYGEPCAKGRPRFSKWGAYTPQKTVNYETLVKEMFMVEKLSMLEGEIVLYVKAYFSVTKSTSNKKRLLMISRLIRPVKKPDWDNIGKLISDALNGLAYNDDSQIVTATVEKWYAEVPRVEVEITKIEKEGDL